MVYLDMDGVLCNFVKAAIEACDLPLTDDQVKDWNFFKPYMSTEEFWSRIREYTDFWYDLELYPWAKELVASLGSEVFFLTSPGADPAAATQKINWLIRHGFLEDVFDDRYILTHHKYLLARPEALLIDDSMQQAKEFTDWGGHALVLKQGWNSEWEDRRDPYDLISDLKSMNWV